VNSQQSVKNGQKIFGLLKALGTTDEDVQVARENLRRNLKDPDAMVEINRGIEEQREHFDNLNLHIGYVYGDTRIPENASVHKPVCTPGARLPHAWVRILARSEVGVDLPAIDSSYVTELPLDETTHKQYSTLDLVPIDTFILIVDSTTADQWRTSLLEMLSNLHPEIRSTLKVTIVVMGEHFELEPSEHSAAWVDLMGLNRGHATLVRPDQHILTCFDLANAQSSDIRKALGDHLGW
jgi:hypothetical protein